jgi:hemerythrin superfamily protein
MSFLDRIAAAVMPPESEEDRANARRSAEALARDGDWLALALDHHRRIESCFGLAANAATAAEKLSAFKQLAMVLNAHAAAEEVILYPAMTENGEKSHATMAYEEQSITKVQMARLEKLDPMSTEWREKLEHIKGAVLHHMYEEEGTWFPELRRSIPTGDDAMLTRRFREEFVKFSGSAGRADSAGQPMQMAAQMDESNQQPPRNWGAADY